MKKEKRSNYIITFLSGILIPILAILIPYIVDDYSGNNGLTYEIVEGPNQQPRPKGAGYDSDLNLLARRNSR